MWRYFKDQVKATQLRMEAAVAHEDVGWLCLSSCLYEATITPMWTHTGILSRHSADNS